MTLPPGTAPDATSVDQRVVLHGVSWEQYRTILAARGERGGIRVAYLRGELELMTPSRFHEGLKTKLARLIEAWAEETDIPLEGYGSWLLEREADDLAGEPDECYIVDPGPWKETDLPDFAVEVVWTSGGLPKLDLYAGLGVEEVWFWQDGELRFFVRDGDGYEPAERSAALPGLDPELLVRAMAVPTQTAAVRWLRRRLREGEDP